MGALRIILEFLAQIKNIKELVKIFQNGNFKQFLRVMSRLIPSILILIFLIYAYIKAKPLLEEQFNFSFENKETLEQIDTIKAAILTIKQYMITKEDLAKFKAEQEISLEKKIVELNRDNTIQLKNALKTNDIPSKIEELQERIKYLDIELERLRNEGYIIGHAKVIKELGLTDSTLASMVNSGLILRQLK